MPNFYKPIESYIATKKETSVSTGLTTANVVYTKIDRTALSTKSSNYFSSFNLPAESSAMLSGSSTATNFPELFQLNVDQVVVIPISKNNYNEYINGRSITLKVPQYNSASVPNTTYKTVVSTLYTEQNINAKKQNSSMLGSNVAFLFSNDVNLPYTGTTDDGEINRSTVTSWNPSTSDFLQRPSAVSYSELHTSDIGTDDRPWASTSLAMSVPEVFPTSINHGYNYDVPVGFVALDKGYIVITHPAIVSHIPWVSGSTTHFDLNGTVVIDGANLTSGVTSIIFTANTDANALVTPLSYTDIDVAFKTSLVCLAMPKEFFISTNPTWNMAKNLSEVQNETYNLDSIYATQIGMYNKNFELIAVAKVDRPVEKTYTNVIVFNLDIDI